MKKIAAGLTSVLLILATTFFAGPRTEVNLQLRPLNLPEDLDAYLAQAEGQFTDIVPGTEKTIIWATAEKTKTPLSIIYLHGYSASRQEVAPLPDELAAQLGANLYYARLTGHGRPGEAMAEATVNDWLNDAAEAFAIGERLGERVIVMGTSTGGTLAAWLAQQPTTQAALAYILISPNFGPRDPNSEILTWPWAKQLAPLLLGAEYSWEPQNAEQAQYWTHQYPSTALVTMLGLVKYVRESDLASIEKPVLVIYSPSDTVVNAQEIERRYAQFGSEVKELIPISQSANPEYHVLAGDILDPGNTQNVKEMILEFVGRVEQ